MGIWVYMGMGMDLWVYSCPPKTLNAIQYNKYICKLCSILKIMINTTYYKIITAAYRISGTLQLYIH